jgi:serine/threonine protein kinase/tetratricopeptide (TPR) repeat protein
MIGETISHYRITEKLGEGGMGVVYKAEDTRLKRSVALKFLSELGIRDEADKARFLREAQAAASLDSPNICTTYEIDDAEGQTFISMAYIEGQSLDRKIEASSLSIEEAQDIAAQVAGGLQEAHEKGIIHRDIKSANIMITERGRAKITDFGLAKLAGQTRLTKTATLLGTISYMSPEQVRGEKIDHRADIWSLGVVFYEMLAGRLPFEGPNEAAVIYAILNEEPQFLTNLRPEISMAVEQVVFRMMEKYPEDRYENMAAVLADIDSMKSGRREFTSVVSKLRASPSIAVLPFADMSPGKDQEYFCDGLAEELINALTQIEDLRVIARTSAFSFKNQDVDVREIGRKLNVETILEGSVRKAGNRLRITAQLVNTAGGHHLWSERYDRELDDVFAIQDEITLAIVDKMKVNLLGEEKDELPKRPEAGPEPYSLYLKGRWFWNKMTEAGLTKALECFQKASELASCCSLPYVGMADAYSLLPYYSSYPPEEAYPKAREAAMKALEVDDSIAEAHTSLGLVKSHFDWDWEGSEKEFRRAIEINPGYAPAHLGYAMLLMFVNRLDEALAEIKLATELDPLSLIINTMMGMIARFAGRPDLSMEALKKTIEMEPDFVYAHMFLGFAYIDNGMIDEAMREFEKERALSGGWNPSVEAYVGGAYAVIGNRDEAEKILDELQARSKETYVPAFVLAILHFSLGNENQGFECLERAYEERDHWLCWINVNPSLDNVRSNPRFLAILKKMGLVE